ncbi:RloB family protein [Catenulispora pinisilvae]|uniref:RloB family protein n=1 Tax=Catenulispora pinisilvae TaxID=2705253 RepID=UPI001E565208|nr:RloB family protein [Catenulispora pinisilvae]
MGRQRGKETPGRQAGKPRRKRDVWFFTEGTLTEPMYLDFLKTVEGFKDSQYVIQIHDDHRKESGRGPARNSNRHPRDLVDAAIALKARLNKDEERAGINKDMRSIVWCVFDDDGRHDTDANVRRALRADIKVAFSHPCFELWRLLHYQEYSSTFGGVCGDATDRVRRRAQAEGHPFSDPKYLHPEQVIGRFKVAKERAQRLAAQHGDHVPHGRRDPYTNVWDLVEQLGITAY